MFKIEAFVDDKRVGEALRALAGIARGMPHAVPIVNEMEDPNSKKLLAKTSGSLLAMFEKHLLTSKADVLRPEDVRAFVKACGKNPSSTTYLVMQAVKSRLLKRSGQSSAVKYHVVRRLAHNG